MIYHINTQRFCDSLIWEKENSYKEVRMFRKTIFSVFFVLVLLCSVGLITAAPVAATTGPNVWVTGPGHAATVDFDHVTIQAAVNNASTGSGDTIHVRTGCIENVIVNKQGVSLQGEGNPTVTASVWTLPVFKITANAVNISGFDVRSGTGSRLWGNTGDPKPMTGIELVAGVSFCNISSNNLQWFYDGVCLVNNNDRNTFSNNTLLNNYEGFRVVEVDAPNMISCDYNTFTNNSASFNSKYGFKINTGDHNTFTNNTANSNGYRVGENDQTNPLATGIGFSSGSGFTNSTFTNNTANLNNDYGMALTGGTNNTLTGNTLHDNVVGGLKLNFLRAGDQPVVSVTTNLLVKNNYITDNGIGVDIVGTLVNVKINDNDISGNDGPGCGIHHDGTGILDATSNWWGDYAGPDIHTNPYYIWTDGDEIGGSSAGDVTYVPWLIHKTLNPGWNIFSAPIALGTTTDTVGEALNYWTSDSAKATIVYTYNGRSWVRGSAATALTPMVPVFLYISGSATATIDVLMSTSPSTPPSITLYQGWNLAGPGQLVQRPVRNALTSAYYGSSYYYYGGGANSIGYSQVISPTPNSHAWTYFRFVSYGYEDEQDNPYCLWMIPTEGYWIYMVNPGTLAGWTFTPIVSYGYDIPD